MRSASLPRASALAVALVSVLMLVLFVGTTRVAALNGYQINPKQGPVGTKVTVSPTGGTCIQVVVDWQILFRGAVVAKGTGFSPCSVQASFAVPGSASPGPALVELCLDGECGAVDTFTVTAAPTASPTPLPTPAPKGPVHTPRLPKSITESSSNDEVCREVQLVTNPRENAVLVTHGWNGPPGKISSHTWVGDMAGKLRDYLYESGQQGDWDVYDFRWDVLSSGFASIEPELAQLNAVRVGRCLGAKLAAAGYDHVHLIAHSAGTSLIDAAAVELGSTVSIQLTFLDAYTPRKIASLLGGVGSSEHYVRQDFSSGCSGVWIPWLESCWLSDTDTPLRYACNIDLTGRATPDGVQEPHGGPIAFYAWTIRKDVVAGDWGFGQSKEVQRDNWKTADCRPGSHRQLGDSGALGGPANGPGELRPSVREPVPSTSFARTSPTGTFEATGPDTWRALTGSPVTVTAQVATVATDHVLQFRYAFLAEQAGEGYLEVRLDGQRLFAANERVAGHSEQETGLIPLPPDMNPGVHTLTFVLAPLANTASAVHVSSVQLGSLATEVVSPGPPDTGSGLVEALPGRGSVPTSSLTIIAVGVVLAVLGATLTRRRVR